MPEDLLSGSLANILNFIAAAGGLGTASFGLVDATKAFRGGVSNAGFGFIQNALEPLIGSEGESAPKIFGKADVLETLKANWINGVAKADQKAAAKSLIRLGLTPDNAQRLADATGVDPKELRTCAENIRMGESLTSGNVNVLGRFDAIVSAVLDEAYERADQKYRNTAKFIAGVASLVLGIFAGYLIFTATHIGQSAVDYIQARDFAVAILTGVLATPLAPVAKDLSSTLTAAVKAVGTVKR
jgi:hypothetical protein